MRRLRLRPLILLAVIVGAFAIMVLDTMGFLSPVDNVIHTSMAPLTTLFAEVRTAAGEVVSTARDLRTLRQRNNELEALVERLTVENLQLSEVVTENEKLRSFFSFAQTNPTYDFRGGQVVARVIGDSASAYSDIIQIDLGEQHGIQRGMPVVTDRGFVGRIVHVYPQSSEVLLLTDPNSSINVMTQASRAPGSLTGRPGQLPLMNFIPPDIDISVGEIVMTSGLGGAFPKGLVVGQVVDVLKNDDRMFQQAVIRPTVDFSRLELVLVITNFQPDTTLGAATTAPAATVTPASTPATGSAQANDVVPTPSR